MTERTVCHPVFGLLNDQLWRQLPPPCRLFSAQLSEFSSLRASSLTVHIQSACRGFASMEEPWRVQLREVTEGSVLWMEKNNS